MIDEIIRKAMNCERMFKLRAKAEQYNVNARHSVSHHHDDRCSPFRMSERFDLRVWVLAILIGPHMDDD